MVNQRELKFVQSAYAQAKLIECKSERGENQGGGEDDMYVVFSVPLRFLNMPSYVINPLCQK